jgi:hypothetical protein
VDDWLQSHGDLMAFVITAAGFLVRLWAASGTYLNPDEAMHFATANREGLKLAYQASLNLSHPPLLILLLHVGRGLGTSELLLRLPSILAGTAFCWIAYQWLAILLDRGTGLVALVFLSFLPSPVALSSEVRQYALLLAFCAAAGYFLEKALAENSSLFLALSALSLYLAMLSHYSAFLFAATLATYTILRMAERPPQSRVLLTWAIAQLGSLCLAVFLYETHLSKLSRQFSAASVPGPDFYLRNSYFESSGMNPLHFLVARTGGVFQYIFSQLVIGDLALPLFLAGIVLLWRDGKGRDKGSGKPPVRGELLATLLILPFGFTCAAAFAGRYPYGGTRHSAFLIPLAIAGISVALVRLLGRRPGRAVAFALVVVGLCNAFPAHRQPYIARADQSRACMDQALNFIRIQIPPSEPIFSDFQSSLLLGHYLCGPSVISYDRSRAGFRVAECGSWRLIATTADTFAFTPQDFFGKWSQMAGAFRLKPGQKVWIIQQGWNIGFPDELRGLQEFRDLDIHAFGHNIAIFPLKVGQPLPNSGSLSR